MGHFNIGVCMGLLSNFAYGTSLPKPNLSTPTPRGGVTFGLKREKNQDWNKITWKKDFSVFILFIFFFKRERERKERISNYHIKPTETGAFLPPGALTEPEPERDSNTI